jgi:hypothetical protein
VICRNCDTKVVARQPPFLSLRGAFFLCHCEERKPRSNLGVNPPVIARHDSAEAISVGLVTMGIATLRSQ